MNVYDTANKLAQEIKESQEYKEYKSMKDEIMTNPELKSKIEEFEKLRYDIQLMQYSGEQKDEGKMKKLEDMYKILIEDEQIKKYFDLEVKFNVMIVDVNKIIAEANKGSIIKTIRDYSLIVFNSQIKLYYRI